MTTSDRIQRLTSDDALSAVLTDLAGTRAPDYRDDILRQVARTPQRPARTLIERWLPMALLTARPATAPPVHVTRLLILAGLLTAVLATSLVIAGSVLLRDGRPHPIDSGSWVLMLELDEGWDPAGNDALSVPIGLDVGPDGNVYVANTGSNEIVVLDPSGEELRRWGGTGHAEGQFIFQRDPSNPLDALGGVAVAPDGTVYVSDTANDRVQRFDSSGAFLGAWGGHGAQDGRFLEPVDIAVGPEGSVFVVDDLRDDIQRFTPDGAWIETIGRHGSGDGEMDFTGGITVDADGTLLNADFGNGRVQAWDPSGTFLWSKGGRSDPDLLSNPTDVAVDEAGRLIVADEVGIKVLAAEQEPVSYDLALTPGPNIAVGDDWVVYASAPAEDRILRLVTVLGEAPASAAAAAPSPAVERASASSSATPGVSSAVPTGGPETVGPGSTFPVPFTAALPSAIPMPGGYPGWWLQQETPGYASFQYVRGPDRTPAYVTVYLVAGVLKDPCHPEDGTVPMSEEPSIDELAEALTQQPGVRAGPVTDITFGDHAGRTFELTNSIDATQCTGDPWLPQWTYRSAGLGSEETANSEGLPNTHQRIAIVDVDGVTVLIESWELGAIRQEVLEANALFESIRFE